MDGTAAANREGRRGAGGPIALVGSGEFLPVMERVDAELLAGREPRAVFLPTAAAPEGEDRLQHWVKLGLDHFARLGVQAEPLLVRTRADAGREDLAARVAGAGLVYLSGGNPRYLADTLRDTAVWRAIHDAWTAGTALAGCSAGAIALSAMVRSLRGAGAPPAPALGVVAHVAVIPHFDRLMRWAPQFAADAAATTPDGVTLVGVDEDTALVGGPHAWTVRGSGCVWLLAAGTQPQPFPDGAVVDLPAPSP